MKRTVIFFMVFWVICFSVQAVIGADNLYKGATVTNASAAGESKILIDTAGITDEYTFSGHIKILELGANPWNGIRIITGANASGAVSALVLTKDWGTRVEFMGDNMSDFLSNSPQYAAGAEFDFSVVKSGRNLKLYLNSNLDMDVTIPEGKDAFTAGGAQNLGFISSECKYEVSNIVVLSGGTEEETNTGPQTEQNPETFDEQDTFFVLSLLLLTSSHVILSIRKRFG